MNKAVIFAAGVIVGVGIGYAIGKKKSKATNRIEVTYNANKNTSEPASTEGNKTEKTDDSVKKADSEDEASSDDDDHSEGEGPYVRYSDSGDDDDDDQWYNDYYGIDDEETRAAKAEYLKEIQEYIGSGQSYNITEDMYNNEGGYSKRVMVIDDTGEYDRAYDGDTGLEIEDWANIIMAELNDTLNEKHMDANGQIFIRCEAEKADYEIRWARYEVLPPYVGDIEDDDD